MTVQEECREHSHLDMGGVSAERKRLLHPENTDPLVRALILHIPNPGPIPGRGHEASVPKEYYTVATIRSSSRGNLWHRVNEDGADNLSRTCPGCCRREESSIGQVGPGREGLEVECRRVTPNTPVSSSRSAMRTV